MMGEKTFVAAINSSWFKRYNDRQDVSECEALAGLKAFAAHNSSGYMSPRCNIECELKKLIDRFEKSMGWQPRDVKWAYHLAANQLATIAIELGYLTPP